MLALGDHSAASLLSSWQSPKSRLLVEPSIRSANYAFNGLAALALSHSAASAVGTSIAEALVAHSGIQLPDSPQIRQDSSLRGWSWHDGVFSWIEPTAWCVLAVKKFARTSPGAAARLDEAERLFRDRACVGGGWNHGNREVLGQNLPAFVPATAITIVAMQDRLDAPVMREAVDFLSRNRATERSSSALALTWLALTIAGAKTDDLVPILSDTTATAEQLGNLAAIAQLLFVLGHASGKTAVAPFLL
jgi:hypothetical protein